MTYIPSTPLNEPVACARCGRVGTHLMVEDIPDYWVCSTRSACERRVRGTKPAKKAAPSLLFQPVGIRPDSKLRDLGQGEQASPR